MIEEDEGLKLKYKPYYMFQETYESFHYTSLLYLNDYDKDFQGGRFIFIDKNNVNTTLEPRKGKCKDESHGHLDIYMQYLIFQYVKRT